MPILSADVVARYHRLRGDEVLFVSGSDVHGTPIEVEAVRQGVSPKELTDGNHKIVSSLIERWGITFDNYTTTESPFHKAFVREFHRKVEKNGYVFTQEEELPYCPKCERFLPDRFVEGKCPHCDYEGARGDQCEECGRLLDPTRLIEAHCAICGTEPVFREVTHWYFDLPKFTDQLIGYIESNEQFPDNARNFSLKFIKEGLKARPMTRDTEWGIRAPYKGAEAKVIYVWFENVLGYISATAEYFKRHGDDAKWREYWFDREAKVLCFIGKDNIPFHTLIFPALLLATGEGYNLPWNVSTNEFITFEGHKFSKSRGIGVWIDEALDMFPADYWRYTLISNRPETRDTNFTWTIFLEKVNSDLNDTLGNFVLRALKFVDNYYDGKIPEPKALNELDKQALDSITAASEKTNEALRGFHLQAAVREVIELSREGNRYLNEKEPWKTVRKDPQSTANTLYVASNIVKALAVLLEPFVPSTAEKLRSFLALPREVEWKDAIQPFTPGHKIKEAEPLFYKIKTSEEGLENMLEKVRSRSKKVSFEEFSSLELRVGKIVKVEKVPRSKNLLKLTIDIGHNQLRTAVAGIARYYAPEDLEGRQLAVIVNLEPRRIFGVESDVMILAAQDEKNVVILQPEKTIKTGSEIS